MSNKPRRYESKPSPEQAWFEDDETGYHAEITMDGQTFQIREASESQMKEFAQRERELTVKLQALAREQKAATDAADGELGTEEGERFATRSDSLLAEQLENSNALLAATLVGWSLPRELTPEAIKKLSKSARRKLAEAVGQRSTLGVDEQSFLAARSRK